MRTKRLTALFLAMGTVLCALAFPALAQTKTWDVQDGHTSFFRATTFEEDIPPELRKALDENGFSGQPASRGAMLQSVSAEDQSIPWTLALVALETGEGPVLVSVEQFQESAWILEPLGAKVLLPGRAFTLTLSDVGGSGYSDLGQRFSIVYASPEGGAESYGLWKGWGPWYVQSYASVDERGKGYAIVNRYPFYGFRLIDLPLQGNTEASPFCPAYVPLWLSHMNAITDFPTSFEEALRVSEESWKRFDGTDLAMAYGQVNLRETASTASKSLGQYGSGTLVHVLGQEAGKDAPWYHVRVGNVEGWMSGVYVKFPKAEDFAEALWHTPLTTAMANGPCTLMASPEANAAALTTLAPDAEMHVMGVTADGWLHVMVPPGPIGWEMDVDGLSGYVRAGDVSLSKLFVFEP